MNKLKAHTMNAWLRHHHTFSSAPPPTFEQSLHHSRALPQSLPPPLPPLFLPLRSQMGLSCSLLLGPGARAQDRQGPFVHSDVTLLTDHENWKHGKN